MKISVYGAGKWGSAIGFALGFKNSISVSSRTPRDIPNFVSQEEALKSDYLIIAIAAQTIPHWLKENFTFSGQKILVASKGIEASSGRFLDEIFEQYAPATHLAYLSGPSFASEVMSRLPTALVINSTHLPLAEEFKALFPPFIKTYISEDVKGAEVAGAYKNVLAIASGICDGLTLGNNARASLISRGLVEMARFGEHYGARVETFLGLSGSGDLFLSASSTLSRNYRVGLGLAKGKSLAMILQELGEVAEGVYTAQAIHLLSTKHGIYTPIASEVAKILEGKEVKMSLMDLLKS